MAAGKIWRTGNLYLLLAGALSVALLFAPLAYASNFAAHLHASIYGSWVEVEHSLGHGVIFARHHWLPGLPLHYPYVVLGGMAALWGIMAVLAGDAGKQAARIRTMRYLALGHLLFGIVLRLLATSHVGDSDLPGAVTAGFQREFLLHGFVLYFQWRAWRRRLPVAEAT